MKTRSLALALAAALSFSGCFQIDKTVQVKPDGSGTITETVTLGTAMLAQIKAMQAGFGGAPAAGEKPKSFELLDEAKLKEEAKKMGEGVTFVSSKKISDKDREGYTATYAFTDINKVKLSTNPPDMAGGAGDLSIKPKGETEPVTFKFTPGKTAELAVTTPAMKAPVPKTKEEAAADATQEAMNEAMLPMIQQMFKDMRMSMSVEVAGKITTTNGQYQEGSRVTLLDVDFNKVLADPAKLKAMTKIKDPNSAEARAFLKAIPGMKVEMANPLKISFQ